MVQNETIKRMVFHHPKSLESKLDGASRLRPHKMIKAFKDIGYEVEIIEGNSNQRLEKINQIKKNVSEGIKYDFLYSENDPLLLC